MDKEKSNKLNMPATEKISATLLEQHEVSATGAEKEQQA